MPTIADILNARRQQSMFDRVQGGSSTTAAAPPSIFERLSQMTQEPLPMEGRLSLLPAMVTPERGREWAVPGVLAGAWNAFTAPGRALQGQELGPEEALNVAGTAMLGGMPVPKPTGQGVLGLNVFHGSPHKFDKFDMSKIGTGEGAQAYGHGLYFSETPSVAKSYQGSVSAQHRGAGLETGGTPQIGGKAVNWDDPAQVAAFELARHNGDRAAAAEFHARTFAGGENNPAVKILKSGQELPKVDLPGSLYKVDLPDEQIAKMLDWDRPLSQQPAEVQKALDRLADNRNMGDFFNPGRGLPRNFRGKPTTVQDILREIPERGGKRAEDWLREAGIPGIRYLDQGSRDAPNFVVSAVRKSDGVTVGERVFHSMPEAQKYVEEIAAKGMGTAVRNQGTSNFVVFDDQTPKILSRE